MQTLRDLVAEYTEGFTAHVATGNRVEVRGDSAVTLWPEDETFAPVHITVRFCEDSHSTEDGTMTTQYCVEAITPAAWDALLTDTTAGPEEMGGYGTWPGAQQMMLRLMESGQYHTVSVTVVTPNEEDVCAAHFACTPADIARLRTYPDPGPKY